MAVLVAEAEVHRASLESSAGILGQQQQLEEAARRQVCVVCHVAAGPGPYPCLLSCHIICSARIIDG